MIMRAVCPGGAEGKWLPRSRTLRDAPMQSAPCNLLQSRSSVPAAISWGAFKRSPLHLSPAPTQQLRAAAARPATASKLLPPPESKQLLEATWKMLHSSFWPVLLIYAAKDTMAFVLHRLGHRLTNLIAETALGIPLSGMINPWWLLLDSRFLERNYGYQAVIALVFILCLPINILLNSYAMSATMHLVKAKATAAAAAAAAEAGTAQAEAEQAAATLAAAAQAAAVQVGAVQAAAMQAAAVQAASAQEAAAEASAAQAAAAQAAAAQAGAVQAAAAQAASNNLQEGKEGLAVTASSSSSSSPVTSAATGLETGAEVTSSSAPTTAASGEPSSSGITLANPSSSSSSSSDRTSSLGAPLEATALAGHSSSLPSSAAPGTADTPASPQSPQAPADMTWMERAASVFGLRSAPETSSSGSGQATAGSEAAAAAAPPASPDAGTSTSAAATAAAGAAPGPPAPSGGIIKSLKLAWADAWAIAPEVQRGLKRVWLVDLTFNLQALPLQALSLLVVPLFWTLPKLLAIQLTVPVAIAEGLDAKAALQRSRELMSGFRGAYAWPFAALLLSIRLVDMLRTLLLTLVPPRWWQEIIELPVLLILAFGFAKIVLIRLQDIMPATTYLRLSSCSAQGQQEAEPQVSLAEPTSPAVPSM